MNSANEPKSEYLPKIIQSTRLARVEAERRLLRNNALLNHATVFYACVTVLLTLLPQYIDASEGLFAAIPFLSTFSAVVITLCSTYASAQNYGVRAEQMRESYLAMQSLLFELDHNDNKPLSPDELDEIGNRYIEILQRTENHTVADYKIASKESYATRADAIHFLAVRVLVYIVPVAASLAISFLIFGW